MGDLVLSMQHVLTQTFIWAVYRQLTALYTQKKKNLGYVHEAKTYTDCL